MADQTVITTVQFVTDGLDEAQSGGQALLDLLNQIEQEARQALSGIGDSSGLSDLQSQASDAASSLDTLAASGGDATASLASLTGGDAASGLADTASSADSLSGSLDTASGSAGDLSAALQSGDFSSLGPDIDSASASLSTLSTDADQASQSLDSISNSSGLADIAPDADAAAASLSDVQSAAADAGSSLSDEGSNAEESGSALRDQAGASDQASESGKALQGILSEMGVPAGELVEHFGQLKEGLSQFGDEEGSALAGADLLGGGIVALGAIAIGEGVDKTVELTDSVHELAEQTGLSTDLIQGLGYAEQTIGNGAEDANGALTRLMRNIGTMQDALANGTAVSKTFQAGLDAIGVSADQLNLETPDQQVRTIIDAFSQLPDSANKATVSFDLMGRQGMSSIGLFEQGTQAIDNGIRVVDQYHASVSDLWPEVQNLHTQEANLNEAMTGLEVSVGSHAIPVIAGFLSNLTEAVPQTEAEAQSILRLGQYAEIAVPQLKLLADALPKGTNWGAGIEGAVVSAIPGLQLLGVNIETNGQKTKQAQDALTSYAQTADSASSADRLSEKLGGDNGAASSLAQVLTSSLVPAVADLNRQVQEFNAGAFNPSPAAQAARDLATAVNDADIAYQQAKADQDKLFKQSTPQEDAGAAQLKIYQGELAGYQQQLTTLAPGTQAYADAQAHITDLTKDLIPAQQQANSAVSGGIDAYKAAFAQLQSGEITLGQFNQRIQDLTASAGSAALPWAPLASAVQATDQALSSAQNANQAALQGLEATGDAASTSGGVLENFGGDASNAAGGVDSLNKSATDTGTLFDQMGMHLTDSADDATTASGDIVSAGTGIQTNLDATNDHLTDNTAHFLDWHHSSSQAATDTQTDTQTATTGIQGSLTDTGTSLDTSAGEFETWKDQASAAVDDLRSTVISDLNSLEDEALSAGNSIGQAIDDGITAGINYGSGAIQAAAADAVNSAVSAAKAAGQISSPSKRTEQEVGVPLVEGVSIGIINTTAQAINAATNMVGQTIDAASGELMSQGRAIGEAVGIPAPIGELVSTARSIGEARGIPASGGAGVADILKLAGVGVTGPAAGVGSTQPAATTHATGGTSSLSPEAALSQLASSAERAATALDHLSTSATSGGGGGGGVGAAGIGATTAAAATSLSELRGIALTEGEGTGRATSTGIQQGFLSQVPQMQQQITTALDGIMDGALAGGEMVSKGRAAMQQIGAGIQDYQPDLTGTVDDVLQQAALQPTIDLGAQMLSQGEQALSQWADGLAGEAIGAGSAGSLITTSIDKLAHNVSDTFDHGTSDIIPKLANKLSDPGGELAGPASAAAEKAGHAFGTTFSQSAASAAQSAAPATAGGGGGSSSSGPSAPRSMPGGMTALGTSGRPEEGIDGNSGMVTAAFDPTVYGPGFGDFRDVVVNVNIDGKTVMRSIGNGLSSTVHSVMA